MTLFAQANTFLTQPRKVAALIFLTIFVVYVPSFFNQFVWDDEQFIYRNQYTTSLQYIPEIFTTNTIAGAGELSNYYRPLTTLSFTIDRLIWDLRPFGFHLTNTVLHAGAAVILWLLLRRLQLPPWPAVIIALIFGLHPIQTEAVTYMNSRGDSLYTFFLFISLICFTYVCDRQTLKVKLHEWQVSLPPVWLLASSVLTFAASVLSKEIAVAGIGLLGLVALLKWKDIRHQKSLGRVALTLAGVIGFLATYLALRLTVLNFSNSLNFHGEENIYTTNVVVRLLTFCRVLFEYFRLLILPYPLHMERSVPVEVDMGSAWFWLALAVVVVTLSLGLIEWRKNQTTWIWFGSCWFGGFLLPVSGIVPINGLLYEHWLYLPIVGALLVIWGVITILPVQFSRIHKQIILWLVFGLLVVYSVLTLRQNWLWRTPLSFYTYTLQYAESARLRNNLAMAYADQGQNELAIEQYQRALTLGYNYPQIHYNLARSYVAVGQVELAKQELHTAVDLSQGQFELPYLLLIDLYRQEKNYPAAMTIIDTLLERYPTEIKLLLVKGEALFFTNQEKDAEKVWQQAFVASGRDPQVLALIQQLQRPD